VDSKDSSIPSASGRKVFEGVLPPKRRRFFIWLITSILFLSPLGATAFQLLGMPEFWAVAIALVLVLLPSIPLGWAAWQELLQRRASGEEPSPAQVKGKVVVAWAATTLCAWIAAVLLAAWQGPLIPLIPVF
jgi:hypothetical protein